MQKFFDVAQIVLLTAMGWALLTQWELNNESRVALAQLRVTNDLAKANFEKARDILNRIDR